MPPSRRRWIIVATAALGLVVGVVAGLLIGRSTVTTAPERVAEVRTAAVDLATRVQALTIEYDQAIAAQGDTVQAGVIDPLQGISTDAGRTMAEAVWLNAAGRGAIDGAIERVHRAAVDHVPSEQFADAAANAAEVITDTLGASSG